MRYDPAEAFKAQGVPGDPVGTSDELLAHKLPSKVFPSCSEPASDGSNVGCRLWYECTMSYRGLPADEGGGPRNHCWERIKKPENGGGIVRNVQPCFWGIAQQEVVMLNKEILRPIADEGEKYEMLTVIPDTSSTKNGILGYEKWDKKLLELKVPAFERLGQQQKLAEHELRGAIISREQERLKHERPAQVLGIAGGDTPLDKRVPRGSKSKEA